MLHIIDHIGIAVKSVDQAKRLFGDVLGLKLNSEESEDEYQVKLANFQIGDIEIELLEGTSKGSIISKFVEKKGEGIHHICFQVDNIQKALQSLETMGIELIDRKPRTIRHGRKVAFLNPQATYGILIELVELPRREE